MLMRSIALALCALSCWLNPPATAQEDTRAVQTPTVLAVPFDPPIGKPLSYTVVLEKIRSRGDSAMELEQELTFENLGEGYLLHLDILAVNVSGMRLDLRDPDTQNALPSAIRPFTMSVRLELDQFGEPVRLRGWDEMRAMLSQLPDYVLEQAQNRDSERALEAARLLFGPLLSSSAEDAPGLIVKGWPTVLGYGGMELEDGEVYQAETLIEGGMLPNPIEADAELILRKGEGGDLRFEQTLIADPAALKAAIFALVEQFRSMELQTPRTEGGEEQLDQIAMTDKMDILFDHSSGLPREVRIERSTIVDGITVAGDIVTIRERRR